MTQTPDIYNTKENQDNKDNKPEVKLIRPRGRPTNARPIIQLKLKKKTNERNVEQSKHQMLQKEKDKYKAEIRIYLKERLRQTKAEIKLDISIKTLVNKDENNVIVV